MPQLFSNIYFFHGLSLLEPEIKLKLLEQTATTVVVGLYNQL